MDSHNTWIRFWGAAHEEIKSYIAGFGGTSHVATPATELTLMDSDVSDGCLLQILSAMPELEILNLRHLVLGDKFAAGLFRNPKLRFVALDDSRVTDEGLVGVAKLPSLAELSLTETRITDRGLDYLKQAKSLQRLRVSNTRVTQAGVDEFKKAMPNCDVSH